MLKRALVLLLLCLSSSFVNAQAMPEYSAESIPVSLKNRADAIIRDMETTVDMRATDNMVLNVKKVVTVLNKNGDDRASLTIYYNKSSSVKGIKGTILNSFGQATGKFSQSNFRDESAVSNFSLFEDARVKHYAPNVISYPYTIIYEYEIRYKQNLIIPDWYANPYPDASVEKSKYTFIAKPEDKIRIKEYNFKGKTNIAKSDKATTHTWEVNNLMAFKREPFSPDPDKYLTYVKIAAEQFNYYGYKGSYKNWDELGKWVFDALVKDRQELPASTVQEIKALVSGLDSDRDKARKIYEYVQKKTRYISIQIGIGGFRPFPASDVQSLSYGDCKALVNYTQSLLKVVDIPSYYCVVYAGEMKKDMDASFATMGQGNHIILCVPLQNDTTWLECTSQDTPFGYLGSFTDDRTVLACTAEGGKILKTPSLSTATNLLKRKAELKIEASGDVTGSLKTEFTGSQYDNYNHFVGQPYAEQLKMLKNKYDLDNIDFDEFKLIQDKGEHPKTTESIKLTIPKYAPKTNNLAYLIPNAFNKSRAIPEVRNRTLPVYINRGYTDEDELIYELPEGYVINARPANQCLAATIVV
jgi:transglutaminase-like putative cysteine protease